MTKNKEKEEQKRKNREALMESFRISKRMAKLNKIKRISKAEDIHKIRRIDW